MAVNNLLYGFVALEAKDLLNARAADVPEVQAAIEMSVAEHNAAITALTGVFSEPTTGYTGLFRSNAAGVLQPLDEYGRSRPIKSSTYSVAWPIKMAGTADGFTFVSKAKVTVKEVNDILSTLLMQDVRWMRQQIFNALFDNTASGKTFVDPVYGSLTIYGLANNDAAPVYYNQLTDASAADNHYLAQAAAIADASNPFPAIYTELKEHPENAGDVVAYVPTSNMSAVSGLAEYIPVTDPNVLLGANADRISGNSDIKIPPGATLRGYLQDSRVWIVEWPALTADYIIATTTGADTPLRMRIDPEPQLQGFRSVDMLDEFPFYGTQWFRRCGFAAHNRLGAVVQRVSNGTYAIPSGYGLLIG